MTNEEKLLILLQKAVENGWKDKKYERQLKFKGHIIKVTGVYAYFDYAFCNISKMSLNDLVTNFEENEVSFIEALLKATPNAQVFNLVDDVGGISNVQTLIVYNWVIRPTSKRLEWLFETFKHLF